MTNELIVNKRIGDFFVYFTPQFYQRAYRSFKTGNYRDLIALIDRMDSNDFLISCIEARYDGLQRSWSVTATDEKNRQENELAELLKSIYSELPLNDLFGYILDAKMKKYSVTKLTWDVWQDKYQVPVDIETSHQKYFRFDADGVLKIDWITELKDIPPEAALVCVSPKAPILLAALRLFIRLEFGDSDWDSFIENFGEPIEEYRYPDGNLDLKNEADNVAQKRGRSSRIVLPESVSLQLHESSRRTSDHNSREDSILKRMSFLLLGHMNAAGNTRRMQVGEDSTPVKASEKKTLSDILFVERHMNRLSRLILEKNFPALPPNIPKFKMDKSSQVDLKLKLDALELGLDYNAEINASELQQFGIKVINADKPLGKGDPRVNNDN